MHTGVPVLHFPRTLFTFPSCQVSHHQHKLPEGKAHIRFGGFLVVSGLREFPSLKEELWICLTHEQMGSSLLLKGLVWVKTISQKQRMGGTSTITKPPWLSVSDRFPWYNFPEALHLFAFALTHIIVSKFLKIIKLSVNAGQQKIDHCFFTQTELYLISMLFAVCAFPYYLPSISTGSKNMRFKLSKRK